MTIPQLWSVVRTIDRLAGLEERYERAITGLREDVADLKARVTRLEAREDIVVAEAKAAAGTAAGIAASGYMADIARRVGVIETLLGQSGPPRLASP